MNTRKEKVKELMESFQSLRRRMVFQPAGTARTPRITPSQWGVLMIIEKQGECTVKDVAQALSMTSSAATQLIDGLVTSGYVAREEREEDRRRVTLTLSKKTKSQIENMKTHGTKRFLELFEALNDKEFDQYISLNKKIVEGLLNRHVSKTKRQ